MLAWRISNPLLAQISHTWCSIVRGRSFQSFHAISFMTWMGTFNRCKILSFLVVMSKRIFLSALRAMRTVLSICRQNRAKSLSLRSRERHKSRTVLCESHDGDRDELVVSIRVENHLLDIPRIVQDQYTRFDSVRPHQRWQKVVHFTVGHVSAVPPHTTHLAQKMGAICTSSSHIISLCIRVLQ